MGNGWLAALSVSCKSVATIQCWGWSSLRTGVRHKAVEREACRGHRERKGYKSGPGGEGHGSGGGKIESCRSCRGGRIVGSGWWKKWTGKMGDSV